MKKSILFALAFCAMLLMNASCDRGNKYGVTPPDELGLPEADIIVEKDGGNISISYLSNKAGSVSLVNPEDASWVQLGETSYGSTDGSIPVNVTSNSGFPRRADVSFKSDSREEVVSILQKGAVEETFLVTSHAVIATNGTGGRMTLAAEFAIPVDRIRTEIRFSGSDEWIQDCELTANSLSFKTIDNPDKDYSRRAIIALSFVDGWRETKELTVSVVQPREDNFIGNVLSFEDLHNLASVNGFPIPEGTIIEGYIVSTTEGGNAGDAVVEDYFLQKGTIDYTLTERTAYLESPDGQHGFRIICESADDNEFERYSHIRLLLDGAIIKKSFDVPVQYTIEGVSSDNIVTSEDGYATMPWKTKHITELTDNDVNTLVTIPDCEIAMRKGPFTPVNEGYGRACNYNRLAKYPILIRDITGGSMYMYTNMTCPYRRNGETLPYGSGKITGIVVHESYKSFEQNGNIGRYQLRHLTREDIDLKPDFKDNFSGLITEFRYVNYPGKNDTPKLGKNAILATKGNGEMCHTYGAVNNYSPSYFYIGQCGSAEKYHNKYEEGAGIELEDGSIYQPWVDNKTQGAQNTDGKGWFKNSAMLSWSNKYWWENGRGHCWLINFSTLGIWSDHVSMQFAMYNNSQNARSPRYWKAEYSLSTTDTSAATDDQWVHIADFCVPDVGLWDTQHDWQTLGTRVYDFPLPTAILGKASVSIRLMPRNNKAASTNVDAYDDSTIANDSGYNTLDYFAVRYNK